MVGRDDGVLVRLARSSLLGADEARSNPGSGSTVREGSRESLSVVDASRGNDEDRVASQRRDLAGARLDAGGDEDARGHVSGVSSTLATLGTDEVTSCEQGLC